MESNTEKKPLTNLQNRTKKGSKEFTIGRVITERGAIEKAQYCYYNIGKNSNFDRVPEVISHFGGTNNIFADCIKIGISLKVMLSGTPYIQLCQTESQNAKFV